jgi:hypothetical protein
MPLLYCSRAEFPYDNNVACVQQTYVGWPPELPGFAGDGAQELIKLFKPSGFYMYHQV